MQKQYVNMIQRLTVDYCKMFRTSNLGNHSGCCIKQCSVLSSKVGNVTLGTKELVLVDDTVFLSL